MHDADSRTPGNLVTIAALTAAMFLAGIPALLVTPGQSTSQQDAGRGVLSYEFKRVVDVHNNDTPVEAQQVPVGLNTSLEIEQGDMASDCHDVRFTLTDQPSRALPYAFDPADCGENETTFWVTIPDLDANLAGPEQQLTMMYGEDSLGTAANGTNTFRSLVSGSQELCGSYRDAFCDQDPPEEGEGSVHVGVTTNDVESPLVDDEPLPTVTAYVGTTGETKATDVRIQDVTPSGFTIGLQETDHDDEDHDGETAHWLWAPDGDWLILNRTAGPCDIQTLPPRSHCQTPTPSQRDADSDSIHFQAGTTSGAASSDTWATRGFHSDFTTSPAILSSPNNRTSNETLNNPFLSTQVAQVGASSYDVRGVTACDQELNLTQQRIGWMAAEQASLQPLSHAAASPAVDEITFDRHAKDGDDDGIDDSHESLSGSFSSTVNRVNVQADTDTGSAHWARGPATDFFAHTPDDGSCVDSSHPDSGFSWAHLAGNMGGQWEIRLIKNTNVETLVGPEISLAADSDSDDDDISDTLEETLCSRSVENTLVRKTGPITGDCETNPANYTPTDDEVWFNSPSTVRPITDADKDGVPETFNVSYTNVTLNTTETDPVDVVFGGTVQQTLDFNDTDPDTPATDEACALLDAPSGTTSLALGADEDGDGVPNGVVLSRAEVCVDTNDDGGVFVRPVEGSFSATLDPDDDDATIPTGNTVTSEAAARNASFSPDFDDDHLPCYGYIGYMEVTLHRDTHTYTTNTWTEKRPYDANFDCQDAASPHDLESFLDTDDDLIPDASEDDACEAQDPSESIDGWCNDLGTNFHPPDAYDLTLDPTI